MIFSQTSATKTDYKNCTKRISIYRKRWWPSKIRINCSNIRQIYGKRWNSLLSPMCMKSINWSLLSLVLLMWLFWRNLLLFYRKFWIKIKLILAAMLIWRVRLSVEVRKIMRHVGSFIKMLRRSSINKLRKFQHWCYKYKFWEIRINHLVKNRSSLKTNDEQR